MADTEAFERLPEAQRDVVVDAALAVFGRHGYRKASMADIARAAGVSKPLLFHWFGTKQRLYHYLVAFCGQVTADMYDTAALDAEPDLFERIRLASRMKTTALRRRPHLTSFLGTMLTESDAEARREFVRKPDDEVRNAVRLVVRPGDAQQLPPGVDPERLVRLLILAAEGMALAGPDPNDDLAAMSDEMDGYLDMLEHALATKERP